MKDHLDRRALNRAKINANMPTYTLDTDAASVTLAKLQNPIKHSFDSINIDLKDVYKALGTYSKVLDKVSYPMSNTRIVSPYCRNSKTNRYP